LAAGGTVMAGETWDVVVIGAGVIGSFHAYFARLRGLRTLLIERGDLPTQASIRNFGMIVPSAMPPGDWLRRGLESAALYQQLAQQMPLDVNSCGTQYLATTPAETAVLEEFASIGPRQGYRCELLDARQSVARNPAVHPGNCKASLFFPDDLRIEPRSLFRTLIPWMVRTLGLVYLPRTVVVNVTCSDHLCQVTTADRQTQRARHVFVCPGADLRTLFPTEFASAALQLCKLQMLRTAPQPGLKLPISLSSGLTLRRYASFRICSSWARLETEAIDPELKRRGIHLLLVQDPEGRLVVGDSHEYGEGDFAPGLDATTEELILTEARRLFQVPHWNIVERWDGVYSLHPETELFTKTLSEGIHLVSKIGGKGMTTGPAVARESIERIS
jgi:D-hydroxyproline dehydrogenase subunit beta